MCRTTRTIEKWNPARAMAEQFPSWTIEILEGMTVVERVIPSGRTVQVDKTAYERDPGLMLAHVWAHLTLHQDYPGGPHSDAMEDEADDLADVMLDRFDAAYWDRQWALLDAEQESLADQTTPLPPAE